MGKEGVVQTQVDVLMELLAQKKYISVSAAAKELGVKASVVEEWARLLEEEGVLKIKYQLTTPYIQHVEKEDEHKVVKTETPQEKISLHQESLPHHSILPIQQEHKVANALETLPKKYVAEKHALEQQLFTAPTENTEKSVQEHCITIKGMLKEGYGHLRAKRLKEAIAVYSSAKKSYMALSPGFFEAKNAIAEKIVAFYHDLTIAQHTQLSSNIDKNVGAIHILLDHIVALLQNHKVKEAQQEYDTAREMFDHLPNGFLEKKTATQERMLAVYRELLLNKKEHSLHTVSSATLAINDHLAKMDTFIGNHEIDTAIKEYKEIRHLFATMPQGFSQNDIMVRTNILHGYKRLVQAQRNDALSTMSTATGKIQKHIAAISNCVKRGAIDLAFEYYREAIELYNTLPNGFDSQRLSIRSELYQWYSTLITKADVSDIELMNAYSQEKYFALLKALVSVHTAIDSQEFDLLPDLYRNIYTVYYELPLQVIRKHNTLVTEIKKVHTVYSLYESIIAAERLVQQNRTEELRQKILEIEQTSVSMNDNSQLLRYVRSKLSQFNQWLEKPTRPVENHRDYVVQSLMVSKKQKALQEFSQKHYGAAIPHLRTWLELDPQNSEAHYMLKVAMEEVQKNDAT